MILIDSNIPMHLVGAAHPNKDAARRILESAVARGEALVTDAEVLQEILHRYRAIERAEAIQPAFDLLLAVVEEVFPVAAETVLRAKDILGGHPALSARDAVHLAVMLERGIGTVMSFDAGFDQHRGITRLS